MLAWQRDPEALVRQRDGAQRLPLGGRRADEGYVNLILRELLQQGGRWLDDETKFHVRVGGAERADRAGHERVQ
jgi:hypothetical protein